MRAYITCLYWSISTITTTGYGDITANTPSEMIVSTGVMIYSKLQFGLILANVSSVLSNAQQRRVNFDRKVKSIKVDVFMDLPSPFHYATASNYY